MNKLKDKIFIQHLRYDNSIKDYLHLEFIDSKIADKLYNDIRKLCDIRD